MIGAEQIPDFRLTRYRNSRQLDTKPIILEESTGSPRIEPNATDRGGANRLGVAGYVSWLSSDQPPSQQLNAFGF
jgi:hypothetical protein